MTQIQSTRPNCTLLAVLCGAFAEKRQEPAPLAPDTKRARLSYPFPELASSGRLKVHTLINPTLEQFREAQQVLRPVFLYLQGQQQENEKEIGTLVWGNTDLSDPQMFVSLISPPYPTMVYLEVPIGEMLAQSLHSKGIPYVVYWRNSVSSYTASHFRHALMSVIQSSCSHTWDAFQLAHASFRLYCVRNNYVQSVKLGPHLLGDAPKANVIPAGNEVNEEEGCSESFPDIRIYDEDVNMKFLVCGVPCTLDACFLGALQDGLNALLNIEISGGATSMASHGSRHTWPPANPTPDASRAETHVRYHYISHGDAHLEFWTSGGGRCFVAFVGGLTLACWAFSFVRVAQCPNGQNKEVPAVPRSSRTDARKPRKYATDASSSNSDRSPPPASADLSPLLAWKSYLEEPVILMQMLLLLNLQMLIVIADNVQLQIQLRLGKY